MEDETKDDGLRDYGTCGATTACATTLSMSGPRLCDYGTCDATTAPRPRGLEDCGLNELDPNPGGIMRDYGKIDAWAKADDLTVSAYEHTRSFPREETYGLTGQLRRAAASVASNVAEGSARGTTKDYLRFLHMAGASLAETQYFVHLSNRLGYLSEDQNETLRRAVKATFVRLHGLIGAVEREAD